MVSAPGNPALVHFVAGLGQELLLAQVLIRRDERAYELRHVEDRAASGLRAISLRDVRALAQTTADGAFRPLKSAPSLARGWLLRVSDEAELESALNQLYPGA